MKDLGDTPNSGKMEFGFIKSPKETESQDGVLRRTGPTAPSGAAKPDKSGS